MTKMFCDKCGKEITQDNKMPTNYKIPVKINGDSHCLYADLTVIYPVNDVHICKYCVIETLTAALDDRPKAM